MSIKTEEEVITKSPVIGEKLKEKRKYVRKISLKAETILASKVIPTVTTADGYVTLNGYFKVEEGTYKIIKSNIENKRNTMLLGPTGGGKTELVENIGKILGLPVTIFDMGTMVDPIMGLVGNHTITVEAGVTKSKFMKSRFTEVIQKPGIVCLDEINRSGVQAGNLLFPVLDFRKSLAMEYCFEDTTPIKVHPECVFIATANLGSQYSGVTKIDRALLDRFMAIEIDPLEMSESKKMLNFLYPKLTTDQLDKITNCYELINKAHDDYTISFNLSMRHLKTVCELVVDKFTIYDSYYAICKGIGGKEAMNAIELILTANAK